MAYESSVDYRYANEAKTVVRRRQLDYYNLAAMQNVINLIENELEQLPEPKEPPTQEQYEQDWVRTGLSFDDVCDMIAQRNALHPALQRRAALERKRQQLIDQIADLRQKAEADA